MNSRFVRTPLPLIALVALLALFLNACCGSCGEAAQEAAKEGIEKEIEKEKAKNDSKMDKDDEPEIKVKPKKEPKVDKDDEEIAEKPKRDDSGSKSKKLDAITVKEIKPKELKDRLEGLGWEIIGEPTEQNQTGMRGITYPIVKGAKGGAASIYEYKQKNVGKIFEDSMKKQKAATERDGGKVVTVLFPGDETLGQEVLDQIMGR